MYVIKIHYTATEANPNFVGDEQDWYEGKGSVVLGDKNKFPNDWEVKEYGYKTRSGAMRGLKAAQERAELETKYGFWIATASLVNC